MNFSIIIPAFIVRS